MEMQEAINGLVEIGREVIHKSLTWGTSGNMSVRLDERRILVTASGTDLGQLNEDSFTLYHLDTGVTEGRKASKELLMHAAVYKQAPWANAVIHLSPLYTTLAAASNLQIENNLFVENMYYLQKVRRVPYFHPGSDALAQAVGEAAPYGNVLLLCNHGVVTFDASLKEAFAATEMLENTCRMQLEMLSAGIHMRPVSPEMREDFLLHSGYRPVRQCFKEEI